MFVSINFIYFFWIHKQIVCSDDACVINGIFTLNLEIIVNIFNGTDELTGISISPKKEFNIIKIWIKNNEYDYLKNFKKISDYLDLDNVLYKKHEIN